MSDFFAYFNKFVNYFTPQSLPPSPENKDLSFVESSVNAIIDEANTQRSKATRAIEEHSWLEKGHPLQVGVEVDWTTLALLAGDTFSPGTLYESQGTLSKAINYIEANLASQKIKNCISYQHEAKDKIHQFHQKLETIKEYSQTYEKLRIELSKPHLSESDRASILRGAVAEITSGLKSNGGWLPVGWITPDGSSHAMMAYFHNNCLTIVLDENISPEHRIEILKENGLIDLGDKCVQEYRGQSFLTLSNVDADKLYNVEFIKYLVELNVRHSWDAEFKADTANIFESLPKYLEKAYDPPLSSGLYPDIYTKDTHSGSCTFEAILRAYHLDLTGVLRRPDQFDVQTGTDIYKSQKCIMQSHALVEICRKYLRGEAIHNLTTNSAQLIADISGNLRESIKKLHARGCVGEAFLEDLQFTLDDIDRRLAAWKEKRNDLKPEIIATGTLSGKISEPTMSVTFPKEKGRMEGVENTLQDRKKSNELDVVFSLLSAVDSTAQIAESSQTLFQKISNPTSYLNSILKAMAKKEEIVASIKDAYFEMLFKLPPATDSFWCSRSTQERSDWIETLHNSVRTIAVLEKLSEGIHKGKHSAPTTIAMYHCLALLDQLHESAFGGQTPGPKICSQTLWTEVRQPNFLITHERWNSRLKNVLHYFAPSELKGSYTANSQEWDLALRVWLHKKEDAQGPLSRVKRELKSLYAFGLPTTAEGYILPDNNAAKPAAISWWEGHLSEAGLKDNPTYALYNQLCKNNPSAVLTPIRQVARALEDDPNNPEYLPKELHQIQQSVWLTQLTLHSQTAGQEIPVEVLSREPIRLTVEQKTAVPLQYSVKAKIGGYSLNKEICKYEQATKLKETIVAGDYDLTKLIEQGDSGAIIQNLEAINELTENDVKQFRLALCDSYDVISRLLEFTEDRLHLLRYGAFREFLFREIFRAGKLPNQIAETGQFGKVFGQFFLKAFQHYAKIGDWDTWTQMALFAKETAFYFGNNCEFIKHFPPIRNLLLEIVHQIKNPHEELKVWQTILLLNSYEWHVSKVVTPELLHDYFAFKIKRNMLPHAEMKLTERADAFEQTVGHACEEYFKKGQGFDREDCVRKLLSHQVEGSFEKPTGEYPLFYCGGYTLNLSTGEVANSKGSLFTKLPEWIRKERRFKEVTGGKYTQVSIDEQGRYHLAPQNVAITVVANGVVYEKTIDGKLYRTVPAPHQIQSLMPRYFNDSTVCWLFEGEQPHLIVQEDQKTKLRINLSKWRNPKQTSSEELKVLERDTEKKYQAYSKNLHDTSKAAAWSKSQGELALVTKYQKVPSDEWPYSVTSIVRNDNYVWKRDCPSEALIKAIAPFESDVSKIEVWQLPGTTDAYEVSAERVNLKFKVVQENNSFKVYAENSQLGLLVDNAVIPELSALNYFVFVDAKGNYSVKIPRMEFNTSLVQKSDGQLDYKLSSTGEKPKQWVELSYKNGKFTGTKLEEKLFAVYLSAARRNYDAALEELKTIKPLRLLAKEEQATILWLKQLILANGVKHCHPIAVVLQILLLLSQRKNALLYDISTYPKDYPSLLKELFRKYLQFLGNIRDHRLSKTEEREFLEFLQDAVQEEEQLESKPTFTRLLDLIWSRLEWKNRKGLTKFHLFGEFSRRWEYLNDQSVKQGAIQPQSFDFLSDIQRLEKATHVSRGEVREFFNTQMPQERVKISDLSSVAVDDNLFRNHFVDFYAIISEGNAEEKKALKNYLLLNSHVASNEDGAPAYELLLRLLDSKIKLPAYGLVKSSYYESFQNKDIQQFDRQIDMIYRAGNTPRDLCEYGAKIIRTLWKYVAFWMKAQLTDYFQPQISGNTKSVKSKALKWRMQPLNALEKHYENYYNNLVKNHFKLNEAIQVPTNVTYPESEAEGDPAMLAQIRLLNEDLGHYQKSLLGNKAYELADPENYQKLTEFFEKDETRLEGVIKTQISALLWLANNTTQESQSNFFISHIFGKGRKRQVTWKDLRTLFDRADGQLFDQLTFLDEKQKKGLMEGYSVLLMHARHLSKIQRCRALLHDIHAETSPELRKVREQILASAILTTCKYSHSFENRDLLQREAFQGTLLRTILGDTDQFKLVQEVEKKTAKRLVIQAPTGSGKTGMLTSVLNRRKVEKGGVANTFPDTHAQINAANQQTQMESFYSRGIFWVEFDSGKKMSSRYFEAIYKEMVERIRNGDPLNFTAYSIQMLGLYWQLAVIKAGKKAPTHEEKAVLVALTRILRLLRKDIDWNSIDEPQTRTEQDMVIISYGKGKDLPKEHAELIDSLFDVLLSKDMAAKVDIQNNNHPMVTEALLTTTVIPAIIEHCASKLEIPAVNRQSFEEYVKGDIPEPSWICRHSKKESIHLLKGMITVKILSDSLEGYVNLNYGPYQKHFATNKVAGPYASSNTPKETIKGPALYRNYHPAYLRSIISYLVNGLNEDQIIHCLQLLQDQALTDATAGTEFQKWIGDESISLTSLSPESMRELHAKLSHNSDVIRFYCKQVPAKQVKFFNKMLVSSIEDYRRMFNRTAELSATPTPLPNLGPAAEIVRVPGASSVVTYHLLLKDAEETIEVVKDGKPNDHLEATAEMASHSEQRDLVIDAGGQFRGIKGKDVATGLLQNHHPKVGTAVYFDEDSKAFHIKDLATGAILEVKEDILDPQHRIAYLDKARSHATDLRLVLDCVALIWFGLKTTKEQSDQAFGRLWREANNLQTGKILIPESVAKRVFGNPKNKSMIKLLSYMLKNQRAEGSFRSYLAQKLLLDSAVQRPLIDLMLGAKPESIPTGEIEFDADVDVPKMIMLGKAYKRTLVKKSRASAEEQYAHVSKAADTNKSLQNLKQQKETTVALLDKVPEVVLQFIKTSIESIAANWKKPEVAAHFPPTVPSSGDLDTTVEVHEDIHQETHSEEYNVTVHKRPLRKSTDWDPHFDYHTVGWETTVKLKGLAYRIQDYIIREFEKCLGSIDQFENWIAQKSLKNRFNKWILTPVKALPAAFYALTMLGLISGQLISKTIGRKDILATPLFKFSEVLKDHLPASYQDVAKNTNPNILVTNNFSRQTPVTWGECRQGIRTDEEKLARLALVIMDDLPLAGAKYQTVLLSPEDSEQWHRYLQNHQLIPNTEFRGRRLGLYDVNRQMLVCSGKYPIPLEQLEANADFRDQVSQIRLHFAIGNEEPNQLTSNVDEGIMHAYRENIVA